MNKNFQAMIITIMVCAVLVMAGNGVINAKDDSKSGISPDSPFYFLDRLSEDITVMFLSSEKKVDFYLERSSERFHEAIEMFNADDSDRAFELLKDGLNNITDAMKAWKVCHEKDINLSGLEEELKEVVESGKDLFWQIKKDLNLSKIAEVSKEIATIIKEQVNLLLE